MNCALVQKQIVDSLAAEQTLLPAEVALHLKNCPACQACYEEQRRLFRSLGTSLEALANAEVPPSLLPRVRARVEGQPPSRRVGFYGWSFASIAVAAILLLSFGWIRHRPASNPALANVTAEIARTVIPEPVKPVAVAEAPEVTAAARVRAKRPGPRPSIPVATESATEVIVLPEERAAFARFVAQVPEDPAVALALTHPAPNGNQAPIEIALLTIKPLDVKPLEPLEK